MSAMKAIKVFKDLLSFLTIIPMGGKEDFIFTTAENMWLFPIVGGFIGLLGGAYFLLSSVIIGFALNFITGYIAFPTALLATAIPAAMTIAFLLVITGLQHFDGLIDLGNAVGIRNVHDRKMKAHAWTVTYAGAVLAIVVEFLAFLGLFLLYPSNPLMIFGAIIIAEVSAKLAMVTIVWAGKPSHKGLGSIFLAKAKKPLNAVAYVISAMIVFSVFFFVGGIFWALTATGLLFVSVPVAFLMNKVSNNVFGGVSGDMIGATNETARAVAFAALALVFWLVMAA